MNRRHRIILNGIIRTICFTGCFLIIISCGRKAPPLPPKSGELPAVEKIKVEQQGDVLTLKWLAPKGEGRQSEDIAGFRVYRFKENKDNPSCEGCPVHFDKVGDISYDPMAALLGSWVMYTEALEKGYHYQYRVTCYSPYGDEGPPSGVIKIDY